MDAARFRRKLKQHVQTDHLLGVDAVPLGRLDASSAPPLNQEKDESAPSATVPAAPEAPAMDAQAKSQILQEMDEQEVKVCTKCELCRSRTQTVFGEGDAGAALMFVGEGPGQSEDRQGRPFVGRAGELLDNMIKAMGLARHEVYIANVVKCRPPNNRTPTPPEIAACSDYLHRQIATIQPKVIVTLGAPATKLLLDTREGITRIRGTWRSYSGPLASGLTIPVMPTFHPAYLLRAYTRENRKRVWSDLQKVISLLAELPTDP